MARVLERIQALDPYAPGLSIDEIRERYGIGGVIKLASNENPLGASPLAREAISRHVSSIFRYPQGGNPALRAAVAARHSVSPDRVMLGNGSDEIIDMLIRLLAREGEHNIVCFQPCFSIYPIQARIAGIEMRRLPLLSDFSFDLDGLAALADADTRLVFITTPDNPSGYCPPRAEVSRLAALLASRAPRALLLVDEAYMDFAEEARFSLLANGQLPENVIFTRTFSKSYGLAGLRIGYAVAPPDIAEAFWRSRLPFSLNILAEKAALAALEDAAFRQATLRAVKQGRKFLHESLEALGCKVWPSAANFLLFRLPEEAPEAREVFESLLRKGIIIRTLAGYGLKDHLRVSIGSAEENRIFIGSLKLLLSGAQ